MNLITCPNCEGRGSGPPNYCDCPTCFGSGRFDVDGLPLDAFGAWCQAELRAGRHITGVRVREFRETLDEQLRKLFERKSP